MPITAKFEADFTQFVGEVKRADTALTLVKSSAERVPPEIQRIMESSQRSSTAIGGLHQSLSSVDRILASLGINIGPQVRALDEMSRASGKTASQLGMVTTAGLAVSAAFAGWQMGRWVADWFGLDEAIGKATASLLGWGDTAGQVAGYKADVIARAIKNGADATITFTEALKFNTEAAKAHGESFNTSVHRVSQWQGEIRKLRADGTLEALQKDLASGHSTLKELSAEYGISSRALEYFRDKNKEAGTAVKQHADEMDRAKEKAEALTVAWKAANEAAVQKMESDVRNAEGMLLMADAEATAQRQLLNVENERTMRIEAGQIVRATAAKEDLAFTEELQRQNETGLTLIGMKTDAIREFGATGMDAVGGVTASVQRMGEAFQIAVPAGFDMMQAYSDAGIMQMGVRAKKTPSPFSGNAVSMPGFSSTGTVVNVNVSGVFDANAKRQLTEAVSSGLTRSVLQGSKVS